MTPATILAELRAAGVTVHADNGQLRLDAPANTLTPKMLADVKGFKQDLLKILPDSSLLPNDLGGSGARSDGAASAAQVHHTTRMSKVDIEWARFISVAEPLADATGWFDPTQEPVPVGIPGEMWDRFLDDCGRLGKAVRA